MCASERCESTKASPSKNAEAHLNASVYLYEGLRLYEEWTGICDWVIVLNSSTKKCSEIIEKAMNFEDDCLNS